MSEWRRVCAGDYELIGPDSELLADAVRNQDYTGRYHPGWGWFVYGEPSIRGEAPTLKKAKAACEKWLAIVQREMGE